MNNNQLSGERVLTSAMKKGPIDEEGDLKLQKIAEGGIESSGVTVEEGLELLYRRSIKDLGDVGVRNPTAEQIFSRIVNTVREARG